MTPKEKKSDLSVSWLRENMAYEPKTGVFSWKLPGFGRTVGKPIGTGETVTKSKNYRALRINGTLYYAHRIAWLHHHGEWPKGLIDHIDGDRTNNAISNLRLATSAQNAARRTTTRILSPSRGVFPHGAGYVARLHHGGKRHYLGYFSTAEVAKAVYEAKAKEVHGEFAFVEKTERADFQSALECEICGTSKDLRLDRTRLGKPRGKLCLHCWGLVQSSRMDKRLLQKAMRYIDSIDVRDEDTQEYKAFLEGVAGRPPNKVEPRDG